MSVILLEGPDGGGKTFLARRLEQLGYKYVHHGPPQPNEDLFTTYTNQLLKAAERKTVFDRLHLGELVYGSTVRGKSLLTVEQIRLLNRLLHALGGLTVFCLPSFNTVRANWQVRQGQEYVQGEQRLHDVYRGYHDIIRTEYLKLPHVVYDYLAAPTGWLPTFSSGTPHGFNRGVVGVYGAPYLFVGERVNGPHDLAFYSDQRSSRYLNECLWEAGYDEGELAFTNAYRTDGKPRWLLTWEPGTVVALGLLAQRRCEIQGISHHKAPHPQFVKRFQGRERWRYVELLRSFRKEAR